MSKLLSRDMNVASDLVQFGRARLSFRRTPTWEEWGQVMLFLKAARSTSLRWLADARIVGRREFGSDEVTRFEEQLDLQLPDLKAAESLEALECRSEELSDEHHFVVASKVKDAAGQEEWLETARRENLTPGELKTSIASGRVVKAAERAGRSGGMASIEGVRQLFDLWTKQVPEDQWKCWHAEKQKLLLAEIRPIVEMGNWLLDAMNEKGERLPGSGGGSQKQESNDQ